MARPREFDREDVLNRAMTVFWARGYAGTSLDAIDQATGLNRGSVYNAFGDKRRLYLETLDHYGRLELTAAARAVREGGPGPVAIQALFDAAVAGVEQQGSDRHGCFLCNASTERAPVDPLVSTKVTGYLNVLRDAFADVLHDHYGTRASDAAEAIEAVAEQLLATYMGLHVVAKAGCSSAQLRRVANGVRIVLASLDHTTP